MHHSSTIFATQQFCAQFSMADISFSIACKEMKIVQIAQVDQLFKLLNPVHIYSHGFYELKELCHEIQPN